MSSTMRHGRRTPLPSTRQIRHELLVMADREAAGLKPLALLKDDPVPMPDLPVDR